MSRNPSSITSRIADLQVGEVFSRAVLIPMDTAISELHGTALQAKDTLFRNTKPCVLHAIKATGNSYVTETAEVMTGASHSMYVLVLVRRIG